MKKMYVIAFIVSISVLLILLFSFFSRSEDTVLAEEEVKIILEDRFSGHVSTIHPGHDEESPTYEVELQSAFGTYSIVLDAVTGFIQSMTQISAIDERIEQPSTELSPLNVEEAKEIVRELIGPNSEIINLITKEESGQQIYVVKVNQPDGIGQYEIDAITGDVLLYSVSTKEDTIKNTEPIGREQAIDIALHHVQGEVDDVELEEKEGRLVYEVEIENDESDIEANIYIDALTGEVIGIDWD
ncbi:PepSY domain-containing protein [Alkalihalobacillus sp. LMS39]|uniref:PepSY domain-containing protein n=1 Tax=Alkalihalobacillus sp. LMS39 TaxID=2924032 RepID=UPI001FB5659A|nr:PepSY domain-containing protein [Alkalihalobacillus sp. LMS39]UOE92106.1 PepSY domain-containing protein [Alkalihalobacillus sp. LMS39]